MGLGKVVRKLANAVLHPLHLEVVRQPHFKHARFNMGDALWRAAEHGIEVGTIIDVGASDGKWTKLAMRRFPGANALAFEPLEERCGSLETLKQRFSGFDYVSAVAGDEVGETGFYVADNLDGSGIGSESDKHSRRVPMTTIDHEVASRGLDGPFLIKLDTHGHEVPILDGARATLENASLVILEVYNFQINDQALRFHEMCAHMESLGFRCFDLVDPLLRTKDKALWQMDMFFAPAGTPMFAHAGYE